MFISTAEAGQASIDACNGLSAGDACIKPKCAEADPPKFCEKEAGMITCKDCDGTLYCKRPNGSC